MTTIAYRDGVLAADTQTSAGGVRSGHVRKIAKRDDGAMAGGVGDLAFVEAFKAWFLSGEDGPPPPCPKEGDDWSGAGVVVAPCGKLREYECSAWIEVEAPFYAFGSGREVALGAMYAGASAEDPVRAAIALDTRTGGDVTVLRLTCPFIPRTPGAA